MDKTTLYLPEELHRSLSQTAKREGRTQADIVREALAGYLAERHPAPIRSIGMGSDDEVSGATSEAWLQRSWGEALKAKR